MCQASLSGWQSKVRTFLKEDINEINLLQPLLIE